MISVSLYQADTCLVVPPGLPLPKGFSGVEKGTTTKGLLLMNPFSYVKTMWKLKTRGEMSLKYYVFNHMQIPQSTFLPSPDYTIRLEWFTTDLEEMGLQGEIYVAPLPQKEMCLSTRTQVRRIYAKDFELGDYE